MDQDILINYGGAIKTLEKKGDIVTVGAYGILWGNSGQTDLSGDWFTPKTYLGAHKGLGVDTMLHHGIPLSDSRKHIDLFNEYATTLLPPTIKAEPDAMGLLVASVLDLRNSYERKVAEMCEEGLFTWSSGANPMSVRRNGVERGSRKSGEITQWPIMEFSFEPAPAEPRLSSISTLKTLFTSEFTGADSYIKAVRVLSDLDKTDEPECIAEVKTAVLNEPEKLTFVDHSEKVLATVAEFSERVDALVALRANSRKTGRVLSQTNYDLLSRHKANLMELADDMNNLLEQYKPSEAEQERAKESVAPVDDTGEKPNEGVVTEEMILAAEANFHEMQLANFGIPLTDVSYS